MPEQFLSQFTAACLRRTATPLDRESSVSRPRLLGPRVPLAIGGEAHEVRLPIRAGAVRRGDQDGPVFTRPVRCTTVAAYPLAGAKAIRPAKAQSMNARPRCHGAALGRTSNLLTNNRSTASFLAAASPVIVRA